MKKKCTNCGVVKDVGEFHKYKASKDGINTMCKICRKAKAKTYLEVNKEILSVKAKAYYEENKEAVNVRGKKWYAENKEKANEASRIYRRENKEACNKASKKWHTENREYMRKQKKEYNKRNAIKMSIAKKNWYENNKEYMKLKQKQYSERNKEQIAQRLLANQRTPHGRIMSANQRSKRRYQKLHSSDGTIPLQLSYPLTKELQTLLERQNYKCNDCKCDITKEKHLDHHIPLSKGGTHSIDNVIWLCPTCNLTKSATMPDALLMVG